MERLKLEQVFGVSRNQIQSYLAREKVDGHFREALRSDKQIIVYGSSKQGKTALVDKYVPYSKNVNVSCSPNSDLLDIYKTILRNLNIEIVTKHEKEFSQSTTTEVGGKFIAKLPIFGSAEVSGNMNAGSVQTQKEEREQIEFNLALAHDVAELIKKTNNSKAIILENFHYLNDEVQRKLAFDLRTFQELGVRFIILGVWREKNRLVQFNGDLLDRMIEVPVEPWEEIEFKKVIALGEKCLNIKFSDEIINTVIESAFDSIGVVQELLKTLCQLANAYETQENALNITDQGLIEEAKRRKADDYSSRHIRALESIAEGRKASSAKDGVLPLFLPYYTVRAILEFNFDDILQGIRRDQLENAIKENHHRSQDVRSGDMSNLLYNFAQLQSEKGIVPPIFDYDKNTRTLRVVDSTFYFFLRNINRNQVLGSLISPVRH